ncbi:major facilitator superfamily domain-containing protein, partial [Zychaea mexicana]|uniref:major facilitator superfamily domain-containing protein n=1 Tax=Zychaea mexicana TaxID=64656 RepID=UPI0022FF360C
IAHMLQSFYIMLIIGFNEGNFGIIVPSLKAHYGISQAVLSIIFPCTTAGTFLAAFLNGYLIRKTSQTTTSVIGATVLFIGYLVCAMAVPFPAMCCAYIAIGFGYPLMETAANVICGESPRGTVFLNFLHAMHSVGAMTAPLAASALLEHNISWRATYGYLAGMTFIGIGSIAYFFHDDIPHRDTHKMIWRALTCRPTVMAAMFGFVYVGVQVTLGSWGYTFLITARSTDTVLMARLMSIYYGGVMAARICLGYLVLKFGEKRSVYCLLMLAFSMLLLFWLVPTVVASAIALALMGVAYGPMFPTTMSIVGMTLPPHLYAVSIGFIEASGGIGGAVFPYTTGAMIGAQGVENTLPPFCIGLTIAMLAVWFFLPN